MGWSITTTNDGLYGIWLVLVTFPMGMLTLLLPVTGTIATIALLAGGLAQGGAAWGLARYLLRSRPTS